MAYLEYHPGDPSTGQQEAVSIVSINERDENEKRLALIGLAISQHLEGSNNVTAEDVDHLMYSGPRQLPSKVMKKILDPTDEVPIIIAPLNLVATHHHPGSSHNTIEPLVEQIDEVILDQFSDDVSKQVQEIISKYEHTKYRYTHAAYQAQVIETETGHKIVEHRSFGIINDGVYEPQFTVLSNSYLAQERARIEEVARAQEIADLEALYQL